MKTLETWLICYADSESLRKGVEIKWTLQPQCVWMLLPATAFGMQQLLFLENILVTDFLFNKNFEKETLE